MRKLLFFLLVLLAAQAAWAQAAYIQVKGEPRLSVYLNDQLKGKTTAEYEGYIIGNVKPGKNLIRIVKGGYAP
ncbi:MAG: hypothetical protein EOO11_04730 [Chitinophagaceae bacterium]|nr:MAG: hypothetical protein EOO11_04730 [Chitinophagaceae bacterium]